MDYLNYYDKKNHNAYFSGMDDLNREKVNIKNFLTYLYPISYKYNSRGFRDDEWPSDLSNVVWCVGDSFTSGIGVPFEHRWTNILQNKLNKRCINLGIDGASNPLLKNMCLQILKEYKPSTIVVMWSFFNRRHEDPWNLLHFTNSSDEEDCATFLDCFKDVNTYNSSCNVVNLLIPTQTISFGLLQDIDIFQTATIDVGRDGFHFDYKTAEVYVEHILSKLT